ncbi:uncharacterized protein K460DRAFT_290651, partial [Cucurbitaria berberidis CBS 394.84]
QVFRFLDLPGELRNRVYEIAAEWSYRCFPHTHIRDKPPKRRGRSKSSSASSSSAEESRHLPPRPLPYIGLTQTCSLIRTEFRGLWLSSHRFPLFALDGYFKAFFPTPPPASGPGPSPDTHRKRFDSYFDPAGKLRLWIRNEDVTDTDILGLLKYKARFPQYTITPVAAAYTNVPEETVAFIAAIVNNSNPKWCWGIRDNVITQMRLIFSGSSSNVRIVVKEKYAPQWMRPTLQPENNVPEGYLESLGLDKLTGCRIVFAVDYT